MLRLRLVHHHLPHAGHPYGTQLHSGNVIGLGYVLRRSIQIKKPNQELGKVSIMHGEIIDIEQILYRCCHAVDQGNINKIMALFHPDAVLIIDWEENGRHEGYEAIRAWFDNYDRVVRSSMKYLRHKIACPVIEIAGDTADAASYLEVEAASIDTSQVIKTVGRYHDKLIRFEGGWRIKEKKISMDNTYTV
jgi:ketosteroid isomerase-like protein